jgi:hypothetical protein
LECKAPAVDFFRDNAIASPELAPALVQRSLDTGFSALFYFSVLHFSVGPIFQQKNVGQKNVRLWKTFKAAPGRRGETMDKVELSYQSI